MHWLKRQKMERSCGTCRTSSKIDEESNIEYSRKLEEAGCRVIYGFDGYKVHSKICLITYRNRNDIQYITQVGTGNYNEKTAAMYTDLSLMTADPRIGQDAAEFFQEYVHWQSAGQLSIPDRITGQLKEPYLTDDG